MGKDGHGTSMDAEDGTTPHTARESMAWLQEHFPVRLINLKGYAPHSPVPGLESAARFLWGYLNDIIYKEKP